MTDTVDSTATAFKKWRKRMGYTQKQSAGILNVSVKTYITWEQEQSWAKDYQEKKKPSLVARLAAAALENGIDPID